MSQINYSFFFLPISLPLYWDVWMGKTFYLLIWYGKIVIFFSEPIYSAKFWMEYFDRLIYLPKKYVNSSLKMKALKAQFLSFFLCFVFFFLLSFRRKKSNARKRIFIYFVCHVFLFRVFFYSRHCKWSGGIINIMLPSALNSLVGDKWI